MKTALLLRDIVLRVSRISADNLSFPFDLVLDVFDTYISGDLYHDKSYEDIWGKVEEKLYELGK
jgi:hypothetical protein